MERKKLLVVVDMQNDFIDGALGTPEAAAVLGKVRARIERARREGETVVFTRDTHTANFLKTNEGKRLPVPHCIEGRFGHALADGLAEEGERIFDKPTFASLALGDFAAAENFASIELIGVCTDICVLSNALLLKARCPEADVIVRADCCAGVTPERHETALDAMRACQIDIL